METDGKKLMHHHAGITRILDGALVCLCKQRIAGTVNENRILTDCRTVFVDDIDGIGRHIVAQI